MAEHPRGVKKLEAGYYASRLRVLYDARSADRTVVISNRTRRDVTDIRRVPASKIHIRQPTIEIDMKA